MEIWWIQSSEGNCKVKLDMNNIYNNIYFKKYLKSFLYTKCNMDFKKFPMI